MTVTSPAVNELLTVLAKLRAEREVLQGDPRKKLEGHDSRILAIEIAIEELRRRYANGKESPEISLPEIPSSDLRGLTHMDALVKIAERNNGLVKVTEAKHLLIAAGLAKGKPKHIGPHIHHLLMDSPQFERDGPGTFRFVGQSGLLEDILTK